MCLTLDESLHLLTPDNFAAATADKIFSKLCSPGKNICYINNFFTIENNPAIFYKQPLIQVFFAENGIFVAFECASNFHNFFLSAFTIK